MAEKKKQWFFTYYDFGTMNDALAREASRMEDPKCAHLVSHKRQIDELIDKIATIMESAERVYSEDDETDDGVVCEQIVVSLVEKDVNELWEDPYTVIPWGNRWIVVEKENPARPVGEHYYTQRTHAHRKKRELNRAAREMHAQMEAKAERSFSSPGPGLC